MPLPAAIPPLAIAALRLGALAAIAVYASRARSHPKDAEHEWTLDNLPEGIDARPHRAEAERAVHGQGRLRRVIRLTPGGPGLEIDAAALARLRVRRV
ncbi:MAG TPA: hypothetical protein VK022_01880 [Paracoccaceae bacterium]|nr:hypothetical protein [Paracoccaceae bacterium]